MLIEYSLTPAELEDAFAKAAENKAGKLVHVQYNVFDWTAPYSGPTFPCWDLAEQTLEIHDEDYTPLVKLFRQAERARLGGVYDVSAPFADAVRDQSVIPVHVRQELVKAGDLSIIEPYGVFDAFRDILGLFQKPRDEVPVFVPRHLRKPAP